jgi:hypothetical protein
MTAGPVIHYTLRKLLAEERDTLGRLEACYQWADVQQERDAVELARHRGRVLLLEQLEDAAKDALPYVWDDATYIDDGYRVLDEDSPAADTWLALTDALGTGGEP